MKATGNWKYDIENAPKNGKAVLVVTDKGVPLVVFWGGYKEKEKGTIIVKGKPVEKFISKNGWIISVGSGFILTDDIVAYALIRKPEIKKTEPKGTIHKLNDHRKEKDNGEGTE